MQPTVQKSPVMTQCWRTHVVDKYGRLAGPRDDQQVISYAGADRHRETNRRLLGFSDERYSNKQHYNEEVEDRHN